MKRKLDMQVVTVREVGFDEIPFVPAPTPEPDFVTTPDGSRKRVLVTKKGRKVLTPYTDDEAVLKLLQMFADGLVAENDFTISLREKAEARLRDMTSKVAPKGFVRLSGDQMVWVHILITEPGQARNRNQRR